MSRKAADLTAYELEVVQEQPRGLCDLVVNEEHFHRVVKYGMLRAQVSIEVMTADFKGMLVPRLALRRKGRPDHAAESIVEVFRRLAIRGVEVRILHAGTPSAAALLELKRGIPGGLTIRRCPRLHAKAVIVDSREMYLGSANLTGAGLGAKSQHKRNFELGVWTRETRLIEAVSEQFNMLWEGRRCKTCRRRDVCPVPLEEPSL